jgi:hypothetical protein
MTDAPEKIWATGNKTTGSWNKTAINPRIAPEQTEYARKDMLDIANARIAELERALLKCKSIIVEKLELVEELEGHILQLAEGEAP